MFERVAGRDTHTGEAVALRFDQRIIEVESLEESSPAYLAPGFIDLQVNGFAGVDFNSPQAPHEEIGRAMRALFATGVTRCFPTVITGSPEAMLGALKNLACAKERLPEGAAIQGFHVEGPHISPEDGPRGAHPRRWVRRPDLHEFHRMQDAARGLVRILTVAPEWPDAPRFIEAVAGEGVVVSIGHTAATPAQVADAVSAGATMSTHLGNGAHSAMPKTENCIWEQLADDRLTAGFIVDGIHLGPAFLKSALRAKGPERRVLVTDAVMPAGCAPGPYQLGDLRIELTEDGRVVLAGEDRLAGSSLQMHRGVANLMRLAGLTLGDAIAMATVNPARAANIEGRTGRLIPAERADLVEFRLDDGDLVIERTWLDGRVVYSASR